MRIKRTRKLAWTALACAVFSTQGWTQLTDQNPDWKETEVPPPPVFSTERLIEVDMPRFVSLKYGVDPATLRLTDDGIVRYVMVATSPTGVMNASYEAIRCVTGEFKLYARYSSSQKWNAVSDPQWQNLSNDQRTLHANALARQGACSGRAPSSHSAEGIVYRLKNPPRDSNLSG